MARPNLPQYIHSIARQRVDERLYTGVFAISPLLAALNLKAGGDTKLRQGAVTVIGKNLSWAQRKKMAADPTLRVRWLEGKIGGGKWVGYEDTGAATAADFTANKLRSAGVSWAERADSFKIRNKDIQFTDEGERALVVANITTETVDIACEEHADALSDAIYNGQPTDYDAEWYDNLVGLNEWVHDNNNMCGVDRSQPVNAEFRAQRSTAALPASLKLLDDIRLVGVSLNGGATKTLPTQKFGGRNDLAIWDNVAYNKLRQEALSRGIQTVHNGTNIPKGQMVGFTGEYFEYNGIMNIYDPFIAAGQMFLLDSRDWQFQMHPSASFSVKGPTDLRALQPGTGQQDVHTGEICTTARLVCTKPKTQFTATNIV